MSQDSVVELNGDNFRDEVLDSETPILVDFWAAWCGPCRAVAPILDEISQEMDGKIRIGKVDVDQNHALANEYQVSSIPTFILFQGGEVKDRMLGAMPKAAFQQFLTRNL